MRLATCFAALLVTSFAALPARAGVSGNSYSGGFTNIDGDSTVSSCIRFGDQLYADRDFGGGNEGFELGPYSEADFLIFSVWGTDNMFIRTQGVSFLFGLFTTYQVVVVGTPTVLASGFYVRASCAPIPPTAAGPGAVQLGDGPRAPGWRDDGPRQGPYDRNALRCMRDSRGGWGL